MREDRVYLVAKGRVITYRGSDLRGCQRHGLRNVFESAVEVAFGIAEGPRDLPDVGASSTAGWIAKLDEEADRLAAVWEREQALLR